MSQHEPEQCGSLPRGMDAPRDLMYLARVERGQPARVYPIDVQLVQLRDHNKPRAKLLAREPISWVFDAARTGLVDALCQPGAAAIDRTPAAALAAAMALLSQYEQAKQR